MKLRELDAKLICRKHVVSDDQDYWIHATVDTLKEAQGISFLCPKCFAQNHGPEGTHLIICWFNSTGISADVEPGPGRWNPSGTSIDDLTFVPPGAVSVLLPSPGGCMWHGFVINGDAS